jgi:hypothetical protein
MKFNIINLLFFALICTFFSSCSSFGSKSNSDDFNFMPYEKKNGYFYTADRNVKTGNDGFLVSGGINNVRLSDANGGL